MIDVGDIHLADLNDEVRHRVLVVSSRRFHELAGRALVAPEVPAGLPAEVPFPWRVEVDDAVYAVDLLRSVPVARLLERLDRAPAPVMAAVRRVLINIT